MALCSHLACDMLSAHTFLQMGILLGVGDKEQEARAVGRVRCLQESFGRAYCELFQPAALWNIGAGPGDAPMAELQKDLDDHVRRMATCAVQLGVFESLAHAAEFHLAWAQ